MFSLTLPLLPLLLAGLAAFSAALLLGRVQRKNVVSADLHAERSRDWHARGDEVRRLCAQPTLRAPVLTRPIRRSSVQTATPWLRAA